MREMTSAHKRALARGKKRARELRRKEARRRVKAYTAWLRAGSILRDMPDVPSDADYNLARD